jgi:ribosome-binding protein aMBF1 (putative translation factor)
LKHTERHQAVVLPINGHQPRTRPEGQKDSLAFLARLGDRVREARNMRGMSRRVLSDISGVSERYLAQLEGGSGNISIILLRDIALSLGLQLEDMVREAEDSTANVASGPHGWRWWGCAGRASPRWARRWHGGSASGLSS